MAETKTKIDALLNEAYDELATHKKAYFDYFAEKGISFELWLTTELAMFLTNKGCEVKFTPRASSQKTDQNDENNEIFPCFLDLIISYGNETAAVEIKIAHPKTLERYKTNCYSDISKLNGVDQLSVQHQQGPQNQLCKLFLLVVVSQSNESDYQSGWKSWLEFVFYGDPKNRAKNLIPDTKKFISHYVYGNGKTESTLVFYQVDINEYFKKETGQ